jgi:hypothetical protein
VDLSAINWDEAEAGLWSTGYAHLGTLLAEVECRELRSLYERDDLFRSRIDMARHRFGKGEYKYFAYPLPPLVAALRERLYPALSDIANRWMAALSLSTVYPRTLDSFLDHCRVYGQTRPTPLLLRYRAGDFNCLHQDLYGELAFPLQVVFGLSNPDLEFNGGELLLVEQQPRAQSIGRVVSLKQGDGVVITTRYRPVKSSRGYYRANVRHGVSPIISGERYTMGILFHDAA